MLQKSTVCILAFFIILPGCTPEAPQAEEYPGKEWTWAGQPFPPNPVAAQGRWS
jgi:hypothetical protein